MGYGGLSEAGSVAAAPVENVRTSMLFACSRRTVQARADGGERGIHVDVVHAHVEVGTVDLHEADPERTADGALDALDARAVAEHSGDVVEDELRAAGRGEHPVRHRRDRHHQHGDHDGERHERAHPAAAPASRRGRGGRNGGGDGGAHG